MSSVAIRHSLARLNRMWGPLGRAILMPALLLAVAILTANPLAAQSPARIQIILDGSGSMWGKIPGSSEAKFTLARQGLRQILPALDRTTEVGLVLFGHRRRGDCSDVEQAVALQPLNPEQILSSLESLSPRGRGPLTLAMVAAADVLPGGEGKESLVLIHDDYDNCQSDPCQIAGELHRARPELTIHVVSIGTKPEDAERMACVPRITGGRHFIAQEAAEVVPAIAEALNLASLATTQPLRVPRPRAVSRDDFGPPGLRLSATLVEGGDPLDVPITWRVFRAGNEDTTPVQEATEAAPRLSLPPGDYVVEARRDALWVRQPVTVAENLPTTVTVTLNGGVLDLAPPPFTADDGDLPSPAVISLVELNEEEPDKARAVWMGPAEERELYVPAGTYRVTLQTGQFRVERNIVVPSGSRGTPPLATAVGRIRLEALDHEGAEEGADNVLFRILEDDPSAPGGRREVARSAAKTPKFILPAGTYHVIAQKGAAEVRELIALGAGDDISRTLNLNLARLALSVRLPGESPADLEKVTWRIIRLEGGTEVEAARSIQPSPLLQLPAGRYRVEARLGRLNAVATGETELIEASEHELVLEPQAAHLQLRLEYGGMPLSGGDVFWEVRDSSGQAIWRTMEPEPREFLAAGRYTIKAETREQRLEQTVELSPGEARTLAMALQ